MTIEINTTEHGNLTLHNEVIQGTPSYKSSMYTVDLPSGLTDNTAHEILSEVARAYDAAFIGDIETTPVGLAIIFDVENEESADGTTEFYAEITHQHEETYVITVDITA